MMDLTEIHVEYLKAFETTLQVLQTEDALFQVAYELAEDAAAENVRYMEVRYSPMLHTRGGLRLTTVVEAVLASVGLVGDYNDDGTVDAADYTVWRDSLGQTGSGLAAGSVLVDEPLQALGVHAGKARCGGIALAAIRVGLVDCRDEGDRAARRLRRGLALVLGQRRRGGQLRRPAAAAVPEVRDEGQPRQRGGGQQRGQPRRPR